MRDNSKINLLLQSGLAKDLRRIAWYRAILQNPKAGFNNNIYRDLSAELLGTLTDFVLNDAQIFQRVRQLLLHNRRLKESAFNNLVAKSERSGIPLHVLMEVYTRGYDQGYPAHLTQEQRAFARVNSFVAGGKARETDRDLITEMQVDPCKREYGTTSAAQNYIEDTPGQSPTLKTIKKIVRNKKHA